MINGIERNLLEFVGERCPQTRDLGHRCRDGSALDARQRALWSRALALPLALTFLLISGAVAARPNRKTLVISASLLAAIIEKVSGQPFEQAVTERIFAPAGMQT